MPDHPFAGLPAPKRQPNHSLRVGRICPKSKAVKIALDAMGGDSFASVVDGADIGKSKIPHIEILFVGDEKIIRPL